MGLVVEGIFSTSSLAPKLQELTPNPWHFRRDQENFDVFQSVDKRCDASCRWCSAYAFQKRKQNEKQSDKKHKKQKAMNSKSKSRKYCVAGRPNNMSCSKKQKFWVHQLTSLVTRPCLANLWKSPQKNRSYRVLGKGYPMSAMSSW